MESSTLVDAQAKPAARRSLLRRCLRIVERGLAIFGLFALIYLLCFDLSVMTSGSMSPTLQGNGRPGSDYILCERVSYWFSTPKRWDLVAFHSSEGIFIMKRVIGLPHEAVSMNKAEALMIDGKELTRPKSIEHIKYYRYGKLNSFTPVETGDGYFVLGDDSKDSDDSRYNPPLRMEQISARPWLIVWPLSRFGFVNP